MQPTQNCINLFIWHMSEKRLDKSEASIQSVHPGIERKSDKLLTSYC